MNSEREKKGLSRREFIRAAGATAAGVMAGSLAAGKSEAVPAAVAGPTAIGANDRINVAVIGVGGMGGAHLTSLKSMEQEQNIRIVAVCDVFDKRRREAQETAECLDNRVYADYRKLLESKDIDAVVVATPDHSHGPISLAAMEAGKHVYVEKPMTRHLDEAFKMLDATKRTKRIVQVGSQGCTDAKWHKAGELVDAGKIGTVIWSQGSYCRNNPNGEWNYDIDTDADEKTVDWDMWLGSAPKRPWSPERYFRWRKYWDYGTGIIGDLWPHRLYPLMIAMRVSDFPKRIACVGSILCNTDEGQGEPRDVAEATLLEVEFPNGSMIFLAGTTVNEYGIEDVIRGQKGNILLGGRKLTLNPERPFVDEVEGGLVEIEGPDEHHSHHERNWLHAIRNNVQPTCPVELGTMVQAIVCMAEKSYRDTKMVQFDPEKRQMIG